MVSLERLLEFTENLMQPQRFRDYCPNGLQVEGRAEISLIVSGVTGCEALLDAAVERGADLVLVHHGYFWKGETAVVTGIKRRRLQTLLAHELNLVAYHLPLDAHPEVGNNAQLGQRLGFVVESSMNPEGIGLVGRLTEPCRADELAQRLNVALERWPQMIGEERRQVRRIAWCTGAAQSHIEQAVAAGVDAYISGEISEQTVHIAREAGINYYAAGHHATERYGVQALGEKLAASFDVGHEFVEIPNPV